VICRFIAEHREEFGVAPICRVLTAHGCKIAPRTFYAWRTRPLSKRALWDTTMTAVLASYYDERDSCGRRKPESLYGSLKMWAHLQRQGIAVARCTVERLMAANGWQGATRARKVRTTVPDPTAPRPPDLVDRNFRVEAPDTLYVADFTYVKMVPCFAYTAFVIDAFAGTIVGWEVSASKETAFVQRAVNQAVTLRSMQGTPLQGNTIHHSDAGSQYTAIRFGETLFLQGLQPSIGSVGDAYDNALAETTIGLYKAECIASGSPFRKGPFRTIADVEEATSAWVHCGGPSLDEVLGGTTPVGSCTAWVGSLRSSSRPRTTLSSVLTSQLHTDNRGVYETRDGSVSLHGGVPTGRGYVVSRHRRFPHLRGRGRGSGRQRRDAAHVGAYGQRHGWGVRRPVTAARRPRPRNCHCCGRRTRGCAARRRNGSSNARSCAGQPPISRRR